MVDRRDPVIEVLDGATGDYAVSGDAMRWSPELAQTPPVPPVRAMPGLDIAAGLGSVLGLDAAGVRRLVSGALFSLTAAAGQVVDEVVGELRELARDAGLEPDHDPDAAPHDGPGDGPSENPEADQPRE